MAYAFHFPLVFVALTVVALILIVMVDAHTPTTENTPSFIIKYTTITGYFLQDDPTTNASSFDYVNHTPPFFPLPFPPKLTPAKNSPYK